MKPKDRHEGSFHFNIKVDYLPDHEGDALHARGDKNSGPGSFWQFSVSSVFDKDNEELMLNSCMQIDVLTKDGGLPKLIEEMYKRIPLLLKENGLRCT